MRLLIISDVHYGRDNNAPEFRGEDYINTFGSKFPFERIDTKGIDLVVNLGDSIADENKEKDIENLRKFVSEFETLEMPAKHVIGNHEVVNLSKNEVAEIFRQPRRYFSFDLNGFHHVILDADWTPIPTMDKKQIDWLKNDLKKAKTPSIVYIHYPCNKQTLKPHYYFYGEEEAAFLKEGKELMKIFEEANVKLVLNGHLHFFHKEKINGVLYITAPSFSENTGKGRPSWSYLVIETEEMNIKVESLPDENA